jgi:hypothetical protein
MTEDRYVCRKAHHAFASSITRSASHATLLQSLLDIKKQNSIAL